MVELPMVFVSSSSLLVTQLFGLENGGSHVCVGPAGTGSFWRDGVVRLLQSGVGARVVPTSAILLSAVHRCIQRSAGKPRCRDLFGSWENVQWDSIPMPAWPRCRAFCENMRGIQSLCDLVQPWGATRSRFCLNIVQTCCAVVSFGVQSVLRNACLDAQPLRRRMWTQPICGAFCMCPSSN